MNLYMLGSFNMNILVALGIQAIHHGLEPKLLGFVKKELAVCLTI